MPCFILHLTVLWFCLSVAFHPCKLVSTRTNKYGHKMISVQFEAAFDQSPIAAPNNPDILRHPN